LFVVVGFGRLPYISGFYQDLPLAAGSVLRPLKMPVILALAAAADICWRHE